jgi:hypothetical protein
VLRVQLLAVLVEHSLGDIEVVLATQTQSLEATASRGFSRAE